MPCVLLTMVRTAGLALAMYGVLGLFIAASMLVVGWSAFDQLNQLQRSLDLQRQALSASIRTVSQTVADTANSGSDFQQTVDGARNSADTASKMAFQTSINFRALADSVQFQVFGIQPLAGLA